ncbi:hypothetical protein STENM223S_01055 [Streptomyces tendae]
MTPAARRVRLGHGADHAPAPERVTVVIEIADIETAAERIAGHVVRTPTVPSPGLLALFPGCR